MYFTLPIYNSWDGLVSSAHSGFIASLLPNYPKEYVFYNALHDVDAGAATADFLNYFSDIVLNCTIRRDLFIWCALFNGEYFNTENRRMQFMKVDKKRYEHYKKLLKNDTLLKNRMLSEILYVLRYTMPYFKESTGRLCFRKQAVSEQYKEHTTIYNKCMDTICSAYSKALRETCRLITYKTDIWWALSEVSVSLACKAADNKKPFVYVYLPAFTLNAKKIPLPTVISLLLCRLSRELDGVKWMCVWRGDYDVEWCREDIDGINNVEHTAYYHNGMYKDRVNITRNYKEGWF